MIRLTIILAICLIGLKAAFAVATFAAEQNAARVYILQQGAR